MLKVEMRALTTANKPFEKTPRNDLDPLTNGASSIGRASCHSATTETAWGDISLFSSGEEDSQSVTPWEG